MENKNVIKTRKFKIIIIITLIIFAILTISNILIHNNTKQIASIVENEKNAQSITSSDGQWVYTVNDDGTSITLTSNKGNSADIVIPERIDGYTVTILDFHFNNSFVNITIPNTVVEIIAIEGISSGGPSNIIIDNNNQHFVYENGVLFTKDKTKLIKYSRTNEDVETYIVPSSVTTIANYAFDRCSNIKNIELQEGVTTIGAHAFYMNRLTSIKLPSTLKTIGTRALSVTNLTSIEIPEGVEKLENSVFSDNKQLVTVKLPSTLETIPYQTFRDCSSLTNVEMASGIKRIDLDAFVRCTNLETLNIPASVDYINNNGIVTDSNKLAAINVDPNNQNFASEDGVLFNKDKTTLMIYPPNKVGERYTIPSSVKNVWSYSNGFYKLMNLKHLEIPKTVSNVGSIDQNCDLTIHCYRNSPAHDYAKRYSIKYELIDGITKIEVTTPPTKLNYIQNSETLKLDGGILTLTYSNGETETLNMTTDGGDITEGITTTGFDNTTIGEKTITVKYEEKTAEFKVNIIQKQLSKIEITKNPTKTSYKQNKEELNLAGGEITVTYNDNTTEKIAMTDSNITTSGFDNKTLGKKEITVTYKGQTAKLKVEVIQSFSYKETEDGKGIIITGTDDGPYVVIPDNIDGKPVTGIGEGAFKDREDIISVQIPDTVTNIAEDAFDGNDEVTIICNSGSKAEDYAKDHNMNYELLDKTIGNISVNKNPNKITYIVGDKELETKGGKILLTYTDGTSSTVNMRMQGMELTGFSTQEAGEKEITVAYKGKTTKFNITVVAKTTTKIEITKNPTKTSYIQNKEELDLTGGEITVTYNDNTTEKIAMTDSNITTSGFDNKTLGKKEITVTYKGQTAKLKVEVIQSFTYKETEDGTGIIITGTDDGPYIVIPDNIDGKPVTGIGEGAFKDREDIISVQIPDTVTNIAEDAFDGNDEVTIICNSGSKAEEYAKEHNMNYELLDKTIESISVNKKPNKTTYIVGDKELETKGGKILLTYTDGTSSTVNMRMQGMELTGFNTTQAGKQDIKVEYKTKETTFEIEIKGNTILLGDINKDGKIDSTDLLLMKRHIIAQSKTEWILKGENFEAGDMNADGYINATDLLLLKREIVKGNS